jgi:hypothetical protein
VLADPRIQVLWLRDEMRQTGAVGILAMWADVLCYLTVLLDRRA